MSTAWCCVGSTMPNPWPTPANPSRPNRTWLSVSADVVELTPALLRARPLPDACAKNSKNERGVVVVIGGSTETAGAVILAGIAALRVGAGKVQLVTVASAQAAIAT